MADRPLKASDEQDRFWMAEALALAKKAGRSGVSPVTMKN